MNPACRPAGGGECRRGPFVDGHDTPEVVRVAEQSGRRKARGVLGRGVQEREGDVVGRYGGRVSLVLKADIRPGYTGEIDAKIDRVEKALVDPETRAADSATASP